MIDQYPKITVVTPSYNQGDFLEYTIKSVLDQNYPNLEYIIIDGGSTDHSIDIIKKYEDRLAYWVSEKDSGMYEAIQKGFERSTGEIMTWINSDDMHNQNSLFTVAEIFAALPKVNWIMGKNSYYDEVGKVFVFDDDPYEERWSKWRMYDFRGRFIQQESVFWRRTLWEKSGGYVDVNLALAGDADLWLRFFRHDKLYSTGFLLSGFRFRAGNQKSKDHREEYLDETRVLIKRELKLSNSYARFWFIRVCKVLSYLVPVGLFRKRFLSATLKLTPKISYFPSAGYSFNKKYHR
ncbi:glycosyltransferase involved in cell wall biosynthesis [Pedobacter africanus]|uniref:Glycosyltransferase involved in cell wall biosynthesis n=1 Tax=Pedobacter africanus TaxID=151894 RepID=A0ACC6L2T7_9SPHI|nr:glycosyltransferase family 2 protein [Pedobacter africanus]MDR6785968.1 glycosyltransferase involved in cell wall biosynthesis [Pedobacter africanus]